MRFLILADPHANLHALDAVLEDATRAGYDEVLVLGDLVGYGGDPAAVISRMYALAPRAMIRGNHDKVCAGLESASNFNDVARASVELTRRMLAPEDLTRLASLPRGPMVVDADVAIAHGAPFDEDYYVFDEDDATRALETSPRPICLVGHTHIPMVFVPGRPYRWMYGPADDDGGEELAMGTGPALVNVGSVGQPRDGDPRAAYGILDTTTRRVRLRRVPYDVAGAQQRIREAGLPAWLATRLARGE